MEERRREETGGYDDSEGALARWDQEKAFAMDTLRESHSFLVICWDEQNARMTYASGVREDEPGDLTAPEFFAIALGEMTRMAKSTIEGREA